jgi:hypothetical protein
MCLRAGVTRRAPATGCALAAAESVCCCCRCCRPRSVRRGLRKHCRRGRPISVQERGRALPPRCIATRGGRASGARCAVLHCAAGQIIRSSLQRMRWRRDAVKSVFRMDRECPYLVGVRPHANANGRRFGSIEEGKDREVGRQKSQPEYYRHMIISINQNDDDVGDCVTNCGGNIRDAGWHYRLRIV